MTQFTRWLGVERDGIRVELVAIPRPYGLAPSFGVRRQDFGGEWRFLMVGSDRAACWARFDRAVEEVL